MHRYLFKLIDSMNFPISIITKLERFPRNCVKSWAHFQSFAVIPVGGSNAWKGSKVKQQEEVEPLGEKWRRVLRSLKPNGPEGLKNSTKASKKDRKKEVRRETTVLCYMSHSRRRIQTVLGSEYTRTMQGNGATRLWRMFAESDWTNEWADDRNTLFDKEWWTKKKKKSMCAATFVKWSAN